MATPFDPRDRPTDDSLSLFGAESEPGAPPARSQPPVRSEAPLRQVEAPSPPGAVPFDQISRHGGVGFVEGVAAVQALCAALKHGAAGVPDMDGIFLTASGDVIPSGPPTGDPAPRELARVLHHLVSPDSMPPAARLFVGRWSASDSTSLAEFATELEYFARPNGHELLTAVYHRSEGAASHVPGSVPERQIAQSERMNRPSVPGKEQQKLDPEALRRWLRNHRREVVAAIGVVSAALVTGMVAWLWPSITPVVAKQMERVGLSALTTERVERTDKPVTESSSGAGRTSTKSKARPSRNRANTGRPDVAGKGTATIAATPPLLPDEDVHVPTPSDAATTLASRSMPDLRIYSAADPGVQPPQLRSAGIPESLLRGFERRTNAVELVVSERGDVQQVRMLNEPQRMPDIMVLSRIKELLFDPAVKNGVAVRYRLTLTWDVTP